jgi:hypothetical protein
MTWARFDDVFDELEPVEMAWDDDRATIGLHLLATTACNRWLSDGVIRPKWLLQKLPNARERNRVLELMLKYELFFLLPAGATRTVVDADGDEVVIGPFDDERYVVREFLRWHPSAEKVKAKRTADAARKRRARGSRNGDVRVDVQPDSERTHNGRPLGLRAESERSPRPPRAPARASRPDPSRPLTPPQPPEGGRSRDRSVYREELRTYAAALLPGEPLERAVPAVDQAIRITKATTNEPVVAHLRQWFPELEAAVA